MCMCHFYGVDNHYCFSCQKPFPRSAPRSAPQFLKVCLALCLAARLEVRLEVRLKVRFALRFALRPRTNKPSLCDPLIVFTKWFQLEERFQNVCSLVKQFHNKFTILISQIFKFYRPFPVKKHHERMFRMSAIYRVRQIIQIRSSYGALVVIATNTKWASCLFRSFLWMRCLGNMHTFCLHTLNRTEINTRTTRWPRLVMVVDFETVVHV